MVSFSRPWPCANSSVMELLNKSAPTCLIGMIRREIVINKKAAISGFSIAAKITKFKKEYVA